jgi:hypothetical protein
VNQPETGAPGAILTEPKSTAVKMARSSNQYIRLTPLGTYGSKVSSGFSVEYWLKTANSTDHQNVFGTANAPSYDTDFLVDIGYAGAAGRLRLYCRDNHRDRFEIDFYPGGKNAKIFDQQWHHVVHVYDPGARSAPFRLYIDGELQNVMVGRKVGAPKFAAFTSPMTLGSMDLRGDVTDSFDGTLGEVAFYTAPLSGDQVLKHYRAAGYREHAREPEPPKSARREFGFPAPTPMGNANPSVRHEVAVNVPTNLTLERNPAQYVVEMRWKIFETDVPPQHFWSPHGKNYQVILEGAVK